MLLFNINLEILLLIMLMLLKIIIFLMDKLKDWKLSCSLALKMVLKDVLICLNNLINNHTVVFNRLFLWESSRPLYKELLLRDCLTKFLIKNIKFLISNSLWVILVILLTMLINYLHMIQSELHVGLPEIELINSLLLNSMNMTYTFKSQRTVILLTNHQQF